MYDCVTVFAFPNVRLIYVEFSTFHVVFSLIFFINKCCPSGHTAPACLSEAQRLYLVHHVELDSGCLFLFSKLAAKQKEGSTGQGYSMFFVLPKWMSWVKAVLLSTASLGCLWKVKWKLWAIPACCEPRYITYNHLSSLVLLTIYHFLALFLPSFFLFPPCVSILSTRWDILEDSSESS